MKTRLFVLLLVLGAADVRAQSDDPLAPARDMARSGHRAEAAQLLLKRLEERPDDVNARTLLGAIHFWDGDYAGAREQLEAVLERYFLFTFLAAVKQGDRAILFGLGDGGFVVDDEVVRLDAGADNAPPYAAYRLTAIGARPEPQLHFFGTASRLAVMTDGLNPLEPPRLRALVETSGLSRNPLTLQRRLNVLAESERFADDATIAVLGS